MKRIVLALTLVAASWISASAQCIPDVSITDDGIYPDTTTNLPVGTAGVFYSTDIQVKVFADTASGSITVDVVDITIDSVVGLPAGFSFTCNPVSGIFPGGGNGCIRLFGTNSVAGTYDLTVYVTLNGLVFGSFPYSQSSAILGYRIELQPQVLPVAAFTQDITTLCEDGVVQFTDQSTGSPTSWEWIIPGAVPPTTNVQSPLV
jgi:PKD repeat protein